MISFVGILILGFFLGMRHATDPDHVVAVMTIVTRQRGIAKEAGVIGALVGNGAYADDFPGGEPRLFCSRWRFRRGWGFRWSSRWG